MEHFLKLLKYMPPVVKTGTMDIFVSDQLFREGKVAMNVDWIGLGEASLDPKTSKVSDKLVFGMAPGLQGADGKINRTSQIGGQPFVLTTWTTDAQIKEAVGFVKWWLSPEIQHQFAAGGGQSAIKSVYSDPKYATYRPWDRAWAPRSTGRRTCGMCRSSSNCSPSSRTSTTLPSPASRTPRPPWTTSPSSRRTS